MVFGVLFQALYDFNILCRFLLLKVLCGLQLVLVLCRFILDGVSIESTTGPDGEALNFLS